MTYQFITSTGTVVTDTSLIREEVIAELVDALGVSEEAARDNSTLEGRLVDQETEARKSLAINNAKLANQINPNLAEDGFFDAIYALFGGERRSSTKSSVTVLLSGVPSTFIEAGAIIRNSSTSTLWLTVNDVTLDSLGQASVVVESQDSGPVVGAAGDISEIVSGPLGLETATNPTNATLGVELQSLSSAKISRSRELSKNAGTTMGAVVSNVSSLSGVIGVSGRENKTSSPLVIDGLTIPAKSTWLCVDGGEDLEIAEQYAIHTHGTAFYGQLNTVDGSYTDPITGQSYSPSGTPIKFDRPEEVPIKIKITASLVSSTDVITQIKQATQEWIAGNIDGYPGGMLGNVISPFEISSALNQYFRASTIYVKKVELTTVADDSYTTNEIPIDLWQKATTTSSNIEVVAL